MKFVLYNVPTQTDTSQKGLWWYNGTVMVSDDSQYTDIILNYYNMHIAWYSKVLQNILCIQIHTNPQNVTIRT